MFEIQEEKTMPLDSKQLAMDIAANVRTLAAAQAAGGGTMTASVSAAAAPASGDFCSIWPKAKPVLELVAGVVTFIPGAGTTAGGVLQGLIKVGDQISADVCK